MCECKRIADVYGKCSDLCVFSVGEEERDGYVPYNVGIGGGDDIQFSYCLDCGKIQGEFPIPQEAVEEAFEK